MAKNQARFELNSSYALFYLIADGARFGKIKAHFSPYWKEIDDITTKALDIIIYCANNETSTGAEMTCLISKYESRRGKKILAFMTSVICFY